MDRGGELCALPPARPRTSRRRSTRSSTTSPRRSRPTAISIAGTTGASPTSAGRICATTTNSTTPGICSKAQSPIFARPDGARFSTSWSATSITSRNVRHGPGQKRGYPGHQEIELALVKLYRLTGDRRRLDLAAYFIDERGREPHYFTEEALARGDDPAGYWAATYEYNQSHIPVREQTRIVGHAVRAMYMASAMADLAFELDDEALKRACEALWRDVTTAQMYVTAGLGPKETNEGFTEPYDLPNETAYAETCASVALVFWAHRMLHLDLDGRYADVMELALYNGALTGLSRDGTHYFYANPLESRGQHRRWAWHLCPVLHDERIAARRVDRRLCALDARRRRRLPPLRRVRDDADHWPA